MATDWPKELADRDPGPQPPFDWCTASLKIVVESEIGGEYQPTVSVRCVGSGRTRQEAVAEAIRKAAGEFREDVPQEPKPVVYEPVPPLVYPPAAHPMGGRVQ